MHLLATTSGTIDGGPEAIDLQQTPADVIILSAADSELNALAAVYQPDLHPSLRLSNYLQLQHPLSVDTYLSQTLSSAKLIILRLLGGVSYWPYGVEEIEALAKARGIKLAVLPGDSTADDALLQRSTLDPLSCDRLRQYFVAGGSINLKHCLDYCQHLLIATPAPPPPQALPHAGIYQHRDQCSSKPHATLIFYRSIMEGAQTAPLDALISALKTNHIAVSALFVTSLKDEPSLACLHAYLSDHPPDIILNTTSFAATSATGQDPLARYDCPVLQVILANTSEHVWASDMQGLNSRDLAMNIVLPELDGRIHSRAISFKADSTWHEPTQCRLTTYRPQTDRIDYVAQLAVNWLKLAHEKPAKRKLAITLANYPNRDGRLANGVGYDTPASTLTLLRLLAAEGYSVGKIPETSNELMETLQQGPTNQHPKRGRATCRLSLEKYQQYFSELPKEIRSQITERWGEPQNDPTFAQGFFRLAAITYGHIMIGIQPARGYHIDPQATYHDSALVPPHAYLAFYFWTRHDFGAHALLHNGKHGNLEWLPGKATGLSATCYPEIIHGPLPHLYPFIVNDPGEGTQAKRRTAAVIIDHLTPPLARAETYGPLKDLEAMVDEYYQASGLDPRRQRALAKNILDLTRREKLDSDAGFTGDEQQDLTKLDAYLCDLKEAQIRNGLHILGTSPQGQAEAEMLVALTRVPRGLGRAEDQSLLRALSTDLALGPFDPLTCEFAKVWEGPRPPILKSMSESLWRTCGDTVERLELLAKQLHPQGPQSTAVIAHIENTIRPNLQACGHNELAAVLSGLDGRRVAPGPSGAPTRGRLDMLPTGRNFYSLDNRTLPTPTAWALARKSTDNLLTRHFQDKGANLQTIGISAWGTSNMRTGGDDIAQVLALIGARPVWEPSSWRVTGFEIITLAELGRPRVDVTVRISGFFRDAFPAQIELMDRAITAVANLDEEPADNPLAARVAAEMQSLKAAGVSESQARDRASHRIFGSKPGAYGAGLQALIDEKIWRDKSDLSAAYISWGAYAYGATTHGEENSEILHTRLKSIQAVIHNQDNREHDLLDSDDYYQFEGGLAAAVETASGQAPRIYHNDHSRPERPVTRTLEEEISRVMRSRVVNPKWLDGVKRHGYKGAFEMAATIDYMFAFAATTGAVKSHHFDLAFDAYLGDSETQDFLKNNNPAALKEIAARLEEAIMRGLWQPRSNSAYSLLQDLQGEKAHDH